MGQATMTELKTSPWTLDVRSLAAFRILLGLYLLYDIYDRTSLGKYDLAWYTSDPPERSYLAAHDTPHKAPLHQFWFYRGSAQFITASFLVSGILSALFTIGLQCHAGVKTLLFIVQTAQHSRCMEVSDGSDAFCRQLLLWSIFLPMANVWSLDAMLSKKKSNHPVVVISGLECLSLTLQLALMYWGTVLNRTFDPLFDGTMGTFRQMTWSQAWHAVLGRSNQWMGGLSAVHYALSGPFAAREHFLTHLVRQTAWVSQTLTAQAMMIETLAPLACLLFGDDRQWPALLLAMLHFGLMMTFRIPNWQLVGMIIQVLWIPSHVWDSWGFRLHADTQDVMSDATYKKTDGDRENKQSVPLIDTTQTTFRSRLAKFLHLFFLVHMLYNWMLYRGVMPQLENGDIGQGLRLSQHWVMFGKVAQRAHTLQLTGKILLPTPADANEKDGSKKNNANMTRLDLLHYIKTRGEDRPQDSPRFVPHDMTYRYPSPRWEKSLHDWSERGRTDERAEHMCRALCTLVNEDRVRDHKQKIDFVEMRYQAVSILPPGSEKRYAKRQPLFDDDVVQVKC